VEFHEDLDGHRPGYREYLATPGMTLRDHFAGLASWAEVEGVLMRMGKETLQGEAWVDAVAQARWILADAMLKAREQ
jgi:hypothetical protein